MKLELRDSAVLVADKEPEIIETNIKHFTLDCLTLALNTIILTVVTLSLASINTPSRFLKAFLTGSNIFEHRNRFKRYTTLQPLLRMQA